MGSLKERQASFNGKPKENRHFGGPLRKGQPHISRRVCANSTESASMNSVAFASSSSPSSSTEENDLGVESESFGFAGTFSSECAKRGSSCPKIKISGPNTSKIKWQPVKTRKLGKQPFRSSVTTIKTMVGGSISPPLFTFQDCHHLHSVFASPFMEARNSNLFTSLTRFFHQSHLAGLS